MTFMRRVLSITIPIFVLTGVFSCASTQKQNHQNYKTKKELLALTTSIKQATLNEGLVREKIVRFKRVLGSKKTLNAADWQLHDELLNHYIQLKTGTLQSGRILVPANSRLRLTTESLCLDPTRAPPENGEIFKWTENSPNISLYKEIIQYGLSHPELKREDIQSLVWNLKNETLWEEYPEKYQTILKTIDPKAALVLPSRLKNKVKNIVTDIVTENIPEMETAQDMFSMVRGQYYDYEEIRKRLDSASSKENLEPQENIEYLPGRSIYVETKSHGFSSQEITFYNPSDNDEEVDLSSYYLQSYRGDVQDVGLIGRPSENNSLLSELENLLFGDMLRFGIGFTPGVSDVADIYELLIGKDFVNGTILSSSERILSGIGIIVGSGAGYRYVKRTIYSPSQYIDDFSKGLAAKARRNVSINSENLASTKKSLAQANNKVETLNGNIGNLKQSLSLLKRNQIERPKRREIVEAFTRSSSISKVPEDTKVFRYFLEGTSQERGHWVTRNKVADPYNDLALPRSGSYSVAEWIIPKNTEIIEGLVAPNFGRPGGASQIFVPRPEVLK